MSDPVREIKEIDGSHDSFADERDGWPYGSRYEDPELFDASATEAGDAADDSED